MAQNPGTKEKRETVELPFVLTSSVRKEAIKTKLALKKKRRKRRRFNKKQQNEKVSKEINGKKTKTTKREHAIVVSNTKNLIKTDFEVPVLEVPEETKRKLD